MAQPYPHFDCLTRPQDQSRLHLRAETANDEPPIRALLERAFARPAEAQLVSALRRSANLTLSLVAELSGAIVGHVAISPTSLGEDPSFSCLGLGPLAVDSTQQSRGIGTALVWNALQQLRTSSAPAIFVLGDPQYYQRFGFVDAAKRSIRWEVDTPPGTFLALELTPGGLRNRQGTVRYRPEFFHV